MGDRPATFTENFGSADRIAFLFGTVIGRLQLRAAEMQPDVSEYFIELPFTIPAISGKPDSLIYLVGRRETGFFDDVLAFSRNRFLSGK